MQAKVATRAENCPIAPTRRGLRIGVALLLLSVAGTAPAALYKWTDANGRIVYSDQPPPASANAKAEVLSAPPPPANPHAVKEMANKNAELRKRQLDRAEDAKKADKSRAEADRRADTCSQLRGHLKLLASDEALFRANEKGEHVYMDDAMKQKERENIETMMREQNCPPS